MNDEARLREIERLIKDYWERPPKGYSNAYTQRDELMELVNEIEELL